MSIKRYWMDDQNDADFPYECTDGDWVKYEDYARLQAEVERLIYVGDMLATMVGHCEVTGDAHRMMLELSGEWNAAKEGKKS